MLMIAVLVLTQVIGCSTGIRTGVGSKAKPLSPTARKRIVSVLTPPAVGGSGRLDHWLVPDALATPLGPTATPPTPALAGGVVLEPGGSWPGALAIGGIPGGAWPGAPCGPGAP